MDNYWTKKKHFLKFMTGFKFNITIMEYFIEIGTKIVFYRYRIKIFKIKLTYFKNNYV